MSLRFPIALVLLIVCLAAPAWAGGQAGLDAYKRGDYATALREWRPLAEQGDSGAQFYLGTLYAFGRGVPQDYVKARQWFEKSAAQGHARAHYNLGVLYDFEKGVPQDFAKARQWYEKAAAQGHAGAQNNLGRLYEFGHGVMQDSVRAYMWYSVAAANSTGDAHKDVAAENREEIAGRMTSAEIAEAQKLAREWKPLQK